MLAFMAVTAAAENAQAFPPGIPTPPVSTLMPMAPMSINYPVAAWMCQQSMESIRVGLVPINEGYDYAQCNGRNVKSWYSGREASWAQAAAACQAYIGRQDPTKPCP